MVAARQAAAASLAASNAKEVGAAIRAVVKEYIDMRLLEPGAVQ
jgi:hypothetical protein